MKVTVWGCRGSQASPGPDTVRYGGNTSCVQVTSDAGRVLVLDAGTGIRRLGRTPPPPSRRVDVLLSHLHMDHIQGLGFCDWIFDPEVEVHIWGLASSSRSLRTRLTRYLSAPLFPVHLRELSSVRVHDLPPGPLPIPGFEVVAARVWHTGPTVGYRITADGATLAYLPDHELALGAAGRDRREWRSGSELARDADLLIHDAQYTEEEYRARVGWGHSTLADALAFAVGAGARRLMPFHYDPGHDDDFLDGYLVPAAAGAPDLVVVPAVEGVTYECSPRGATTPPRSEVRAGGVTA